MKYKAGDIVLIDINQTELKNPDSIDIIKSHYPWVVLVAENDGVDLRSDWEEVKDEIMYKVVTCKFTQNQDLKEKLLAAGDKTLIEGNTWNDRYWGVCRGKGQNKLGQILMRVREELRYNNGEK